jgi:hypothetical protein
MSLIRIPENHPICGETLFILRLLKQPELRIWHFPSPPTQLSSCPLKIPTCEGTAPSFVMFYLFICCFSVCAVCSHSYTSTQARYHERTCTRTTVEVKYPDPFSDKPGAVTDEVLTRDPGDLTFRCIYCDFDHKDTERVKVSSSHIMPRFYQYRHLTESWQIMHEGKGWSHT